MKSARFRPLLLTATLAGFMLAGAPSGRADTTPSDRTTTAPSATIAGFRSAHFGMDEKAVKHAIVTDFNLGPADIKSSTNPVQQTADLSIIVPNLADGSGKAKVDYVFGYNSHQLIEVNIDWSTANDPANTPVVLLRIAASLQSYFEAEGFPSAQEAANVELPGGALLVFRGIDSGGHAVLITLSGPVSKPDADKHVTMTPAHLMLVYASDPEHPDVYKVAKGAF